MQDSGEEHSTDPLGCTTMLSGDSYRVKLTVTYVMPTLLSVGTLMRAIRYLEKSASNIVEPYTALLS